MKISNITTYITPKSTGYAAAAGICLAAYSGFAKNRQIKKVHKPIAFMTGVAAIMHIGIIEYYNHRYKSEK